MFVLAVTGHRPQRVGGFGPSNVQTWVREQLHDVLTRAKAQWPDVVAMSGMALGVDTWWAEEALAVDVPVWAAVPFDGQERIWPDASQDAYRAILAHCAYVDRLAPTPTKDSDVSRLLLARNTWMSTKAQAAVAVWDGSTGGTAHAVRQFTSRAVPVLRINPSTRTVDCVVNKS